MFLEISNTTADAENQATAPILRNALRYAGVILIPRLVGVTVLDPHILRIYGQEFTVSGTVLAYWYVDDLIVFDFPYAAIRKQRLFAHEWRSLLSAQGRITVIHVLTVSSRDPHRNRFGRYPADATANRRWRCRRRQSVIRRAGPADGAGVDR